MDKENDIISYDFQGWPNYKRNLREVLNMMGAVEENGMIGFKTNDDILDIYPLILEDDGMGYGVNERYITEASADMMKTYVNIFAESEIEDVVDDIKRGKLDLKELNNE